MTEEIKLIIAEIDKRMKINSDLWQSVKKEADFLQGYHAGYEDGAGDIRDFIIKQFNVKEDEL